MDDDEVKTPAQVARARIVALSEEFDASEGRHRAPAAAEPQAEEPADHRPRFRMVLDAPQARVAVGLLIVGVLAALWWTREGTESGSPPIETPSVLVEADHEPEEVVVHVGGDVVEPGLVTLPAGTRVVDAVEAAGGARDPTDLDVLNLARPLVDGEQILVGVELPEPGDGEGGSPSAGPISLNQATAEQLQTLPGVGPVTAQAIVGWREGHGGFTQVEDLLEVRGIGEARLAELRPLVTP